MVGDVAPGTPLLRFEHVQYAYGDVPALLDVSLEITAGERVAVIGPNGSGKTTLAKLSNGLLRPHAGRVIVAGHDTTGRAPGELARIVGYVFQNPDHQLFQPTVEQEIAFGPRTLGLSPSAVAKRVEAMLALFSLTPYRRQHPTLLRRGLRQLIALAAVYALDPAVLVLDEALSALDVPQAMHVLGMLERDCHQGRSIVLITHDLQLAAWAERAVLIEHGRILADGPARVILGDAALLERAGLDPLPATTLADRLLHRRGVLSPHELIALLSQARVATKTDDANGPR